MIALVLGLAPSRASGLSNEVGDGTSLADLGVMSEILLSADEPSYLQTDLTIPESYSAVDSPEGLVFNARFRVELSEVPLLSELEESRLSISLNGKAIIEMRIVLVNGVATMHGNGWVDDDPNLELVPGVPAELDFANYVQYGSTEQADDELTVRLDASEGLALHLTVALLPESYFSLEINPSQIVTLQISSVEVDSSVGEVRVEYEVQSSKAESATIALESRAGTVGDVRNFDDEGNRSDILTLEQGVARGTAIVDLERGADFVHGFLVATTRFNSPAEEFTITTSDRRKVNWPVLVALAGLVVGFAVYRSRQSRRNAASKRSVERSPVDQVFFALGAGAIAFPVVYTVFFVERRTELDGLAIVFGAYVSAFQLVVWALLLWLMRARGTRFAAARFGIGAWASLGSALLVVAIALNVGVAVAWYLGASAAAALVARPVE